MVDPSPVMLLAEDNPSHAKLILRSLQPPGSANRIFHVSDGEAALDYLFRQGAFADPTQSPSPNVIVIDLRMPKFDGLEVLRRIKTTDHLRPIPVVVLTSSEADTDIRRAYELHANSYLVKPVDFARFEELMRDMGVYWMTWNRSTL